MGAVGYALSAGEVLEDVRCMSLHILEAVEGVCHVPEAVERYAFAGGAGGDELCAALYYAGAVESVRHVLELL